MNKLLTILLIGTILVYGLGGSTLSIKIPTLYQSSILDEYDMVIIAPEIFTNNIQPLIDHKNNIGIKSTLKTLESIYDEYLGRDEAEKIKYFIKYGLDEWNIKYIMLVGNKELVPVRYTVDCYWDIYSDFISDLYYADIFDSDGNYCSWDSNNDNIFSGKNMSGLEDDIDLYPDVCVGRLLCNNNSEVDTIINKIIIYEKNTYNQSWFKNLILCGGDFAELGILEAFMPFMLGERGRIVFEGEYISNIIAKYLDSFNAIKIYASNFININLKGLSVSSINEWINQGAGFLTFYGHGSPNVAITTNFPFCKKIWLPKPDGYYESKHIKYLQNGYKLPVVVFLGCNCGNFDNISSPIAWNFVKHENGGGIASFSNTWGSVGIDSSICTETLTPFLMLEIFRQYDYGINILGELWKNSITNYLNNDRAMFLGERFSIFNWNHNLANYIALQEWMLFGDPSLKIGGYPSGE